MRTAIYARVSTPRQARDQNTDQQLARLERYAEQKGRVLDGERVYLDEGYSGATLNRPGLDALRDAVAMAEFAAVLITAPDRLARNYVHQVLLIEELQDCGCRVEFVERPMSQDPNDQLLLQIRGAVAECERTLIAERMRRGRLAKLRAGALLPWTYAPYGHRMSPDRPRDPRGVTLDAAEAAVVAELFAMYREPGSSLLQLAMHLDARRAYAVRRAAVVEPHDPRHPAQPDLHGPGLRAADAVSSAHPPVLGDTPDRASPR